MSIRFSAIYVRTPEALPPSARPAGPAWSALEVDDVPLGDETGYEEDPELCTARGPSARYGEAIYVFEDEGTDQLCYDHCRDGVLLRKLVYSFDGCASSWTCIAGTPEPWEDELFGAAAKKNKGVMASVAFHLFNQVRRGEDPKLFGAYGDYGPGEQSRDFVHVGDVADVNLWIWKRGVSGLFNCGTGRAEPFRTVAETVIATLGQGRIEYVAFPEHLKGRYQSFTQADMSRLRAAGYNGAFRDVSRGDPKPHTLRGDALTTARLTPETWRLEIVGDGSCQLAHPARLEASRASAESWIAILHPSRIVALKSG